MYRALADKLLDLAYLHAKEIAVRWHEALVANPRTPSYHSLPKERLVLQAVSFYKELKELYFVENSYQEVLRFLERTRYVEDMYGEGVPPHEAIYALTLMRRHMWLYAELQALFTTASDMFQAMESINRALLLFDYAQYIVVQKYHDLTHSMTDV